MKEDDPRDWLIELLRSDPEDPGLREGIPLSSLALLKACSSDKRENKQAFTKFLVIIGFPPSAIAFAKLGRSPLKHARLQLCIL